MKRSEFNEAVTRLGYGDYLPGGARDFFTLPQLLREIAWNYFKGNIPKPVEPEGESRTSAILRYDMSIELVRQVATELDVRGWVEFDDGVEE